jgi:hypothetical protein
MCGFQEGRETVSRMAHIDKSRPKKESWKFLPGNTRVEGDFNEELRRFPPGNPEARVNTLTT